MKNDLYPSQVLEISGKHDMDTKYPMIVTELDKVNSIIECEMVDTKWQCIIPRSLLAQAPQIEKMIERRELYALIDISGVEITWNDMITRPDKLVFTCGVFLDFAVGMINQEQMSGVRRVAMYKSPIDGSATILTPVIRINRPLGKFQSNGYNESSFQLYTSNCIIVEGKLDGSGLIENPFNGAVPTGTGMSVNWVTHYKPALKFQSWLNRKGTLKDITNLEQAAHMLWAEYSKDTSDREEREAARGTAEDARELFDTPKSMRSRFLKNLYNFGCFENTEIRQIDWERYTPTQFVKEMFSRLKKKNSTIRLCYFSPSTSSWAYQDGGSELKKIDDGKGYETTIKGLRSENFKKFIEDKNSWTTPYFAICERVGKKWNVELAFIEIAKTEVESPEWLNAVYGLQRYKHLMCNTEGDCEAALLQQLTNDAYPRSEVLFYLEHRGTKFRGQKHLISYVPWEERWFYHGWFHDGAPGTKQLYYGACSSILATFMRWYPKRNVIAGIMPEEQWRPRIHEDFRIEMSVGAVPFFEIPTRKKQNDDK